MKIISRKSRLLVSVVAACAIVAGVVISFQVNSSTSTTNTEQSAPASIPVTASPVGTVCGQSVLNSPFSYHGQSGSYVSGTLGLPTYGKSGTDFPDATAGMVLPVGTNDYPSYKLNPETVYYLLPGTHTGSFQADTGDAFVGGSWQGQTSILNGNYASGGQAIDSNESIGNQPGVTVEYLTIEKYTPDGNAGAVNQEANTGWTIRYNTITLNVPGAGVMLGSTNTLHANCLTQNGQYGFQSNDTDGFDRDSLTTGPYGITVSDNEISYNDTCDFSGLITNKAAHLQNANPVPAKYRNAQCGTVVGDGDQGGFKLWETNGVTIADNFIHNNWGPGGWADTSNANTTWTGNTITDNEGEGIIEEISYNFGIKGNYIANNDWIDGLGNPSFPEAAIYISESGSDTTFGGVPGCTETGCVGQKSYVHQSVISGNNLVNNGGSIFLWQSSTRFCSDGYDSPCTLVDGSDSPFTVANCKANLPTAAINIKTFKGLTTGSPAEDWWDGCLWRTANVAISGNTIDFNPAKITDCNSAEWPDCGAGGTFSQYGSPTKNQPDWIIPTQLTFFQNNVWSDNTYHGPSPIFAWNQGNGDNPVTWTMWSNSAATGDKCSSVQETQSGYCKGPFGQDAGSTYNLTPVS
jgi:Right handed beta helix region